MNLELIQSFGLEIEDRGAQEETQIQDPSWSGQEHGGEAAEYGS